MPPIRPKNLNLLTIRFPLMAIVSILHRISGFVLFLFIPLALWLWQASLSDTGFEAIQYWMESVWLKLLVWLLLAPFCYHLVAGVRHLLSDLHVGNTKTGALKAGMTTFVVSILLFILVGVWVW